MEFQLKNKFGQLGIKNPKQHIFRQLSSCINEKNNGFYVISIECSQKLRKSLNQLI